MSKKYLAEFRDAERLQLAVARVIETPHQALDAFTPYPVDGLDRALGFQTSRIRPAMLLGGTVTAAIAYAVQWYSAVIDYPLNSGGRPLHSWQVFLLVPFEIGIFAATFCGVVAFLWTCGLPRLNHPLFEVPNFERATQDHYFLLAAESAAHTSCDLRQMLQDAGAVVVTELDPP